MMTIISPLVFPEFILFFMASMALIGHCFWHKRVKDFSYIVCQIGFLLALAALFLFDTHLNLNHQFYWHHQFILDHLALVLKSIILLIGFAVIRYSHSYVEYSDLQRGEYFPLMTYATVGMLFLVSAHNFLLMYMSLELMSLPIYALIALRRNSKRNIEAAVKYFVMGALASGLILYGMSIVYGITHVLDISLIAQKVSNVHTHYELILLGIGTIFILSGIAFKLGLVPFHMWLPDVYEGAPISVVLLMAALPKLAIFALLLRILIEGITVFSSHWNQVILILGLLSIVLGNIAAVIQTNIKRLFAYSTIAHMGFILLGVYVASNAGLSAALYYIVSYSLMSVGGFAMLLLLSKRGIEAEKIEDLKGLNSRINTIRPAPNTNN